MRCSASDCTAGSDQLSSSDVNRTNGIPGLTRCSPTGDVTTQPAERNVAQALRIASLCCLKLPITAMVMLTRYSIWAIRNRGICTLSPLGFENAPARRVPVLQLDTRGPIRERRTTFR
jgi:hypothetical protein